MVIDEKNVDTNGNYWSRVVTGTNTHNFNFNSCMANMNTRFQANGNAVRCLKGYGILKSQPICKYTVW